MEPTLCKRCVLPHSPPDVVLDDEGICNVCRQHDRARQQQGQAPQLLETDLIKIIKRAQKLKKKKKGRYDCLVMCSGGKDSTSTLYYAVKRYKLSPLAFTFDHDFETDDALDNVRRAVDALGVEWMYFRSTFMKEMFSTLVKSGSKAVICHLCAMWYRQTTFEIAHNFNVPLIIAGWTKGQTTEQPVLSKCACETGTPEYQSMGEATQDFLDKHLPILPKYQGFPRSMAEVATVGQKKYKIRVVSPHWFLPQSADEYTAVIQKELGWRYPKQSYPEKSTNCALNFLSVELSMKNFGYTHYHVEMSTMIRLGMMTRDEALALLAKNYDDAQLEDVLHKMGCSLEDIRT